MQGLHLTADLYNCRCDAAWLTDAERVADWCLRAVEASGLKPSSHVFHTFSAALNPGPCVSAAVLMDGSHVCLHTWTARRSVTADVYVCNSGGDHSAQARDLMDALVNRFQPEWTEQRSLDRGSGDA